MLVYALLYFGRGEEGWGADEHDDFMVEK